MQQQNSSSDFILLCYRWSTRYMYLRFRFLFFFFPISFNVTESLFNSQEILHLIFLYIWLEKEEMVLLRNKNLRKYKIMENAWINHLKIAEELSWGEKKKLMNHVTFKHFYSAFFTVFLKLPYYSQMSELFFSFVFSNIG